MKKNIFIISIFLVTMFFCGVEKVWASDLNYEVSLNGNWRFRPEQRAWTTIPVPEFWDAKPDFRTPDEWGNGKNGFAAYATYELQNIPLPSKCTGVVKVEFEGVNHVADVFVNNQSVGQNIGGWIPFGFDITNQTVPGSPFTLRVEVKGGSLPPIVNSSGKVQWPVGWFGHEESWGIIDDVKLKCYGDVYIKDAFIKTSFRNKRIEVDYEVVNASNRSRTITIAAGATPTDSSAREISLASSAITLSAGQTRTITVSQVWNNPSLWMPDDPNLYYLDSNVMENGMAIDSNRTRFGFREIWISSMNYVLNGVRLNLRRESTGEQSQSSYIRYETSVPSKWNSSIDKLFSYNINAVRFHASPAPDYMLQRADERGLLVIEESAIYSRSYLVLQNDPARRAIFLNNSIEWLKPWVRDRRNHPSVIIWSAENEMYTHRHNLTAPEVMELQNTVRSLDPTRPIILEDNLPYDMYNFNEVRMYHYRCPTVQNSTYFSTASIYRLGTYKDAETGNYIDCIDTTRPNAIGEYMYDLSDDPDYLLVPWYQSLFVRAYRYLNFADISPFRLNWAWRGSKYPEAAEFLKRSLAPVALFDKAYDDLKTDPIKDGIYPRINEGANITRTLVLYNDEFRDTSVTAKVAIRSGATTYATGQRIYNLPLGDHREFSISFQVPNIGGSNVEMILTTEKGGVEKFRESKIFRVTETGSTGTTSSVVIIDNTIPSKPDTTPPSNPTGLSVS